MNFVGYDYRKERKGDGTDSINTMGPLENFVEDDSETS